MAFTLRRSSAGSGRSRGSQSDGTMTLVEHLYELRKRLFRAVLAIAVAAIASAFFYDEIITLLRDPFENAIEKLASQRGDLNAQLTINDPAGPFLLQLKIALVSGLVLSSPVWLWQIWAFVVPGLHSNERRWSMVFAAVAGPLFMGGVLLGYYVLPKGLGILLAFTPADVSNFIELDRYLNFILRMLLVFGVAFEIPLFVVLLNLAGVVTGRTLGANRAWIILGVFVFAAVATPSQDPFSMLMLAIPMAILFELAVAVASVHDRRKARRERAESYEELPDDVTSPLDYTQSSIDEPLDDLRR